MNILRSARIEGFWGSKDFTIDFHPDVNFLIGVNGSGKTTLINLIAAGLTADLAMLERVQFTGLQINLVDTKTKRKPSIEISKRPSKDLPVAELSYRIRDQASSPPKDYPLDDFRQHAVFSARRQMLELNRRRAFTVSEHLKKLANVSWLSIHRSQTPRTQEEKSFESTVDMKLDQLQNDLVKYFSLLARRSEAEVSRFQKTVFLSLVNQQVTPDLFASFSSLNLEEETNSLVQIFKQFGMDEQQFAAQVTQHFQMVRSMQESTAKSSGYSTNQFAAALANARIHSLVQEWQKIGERQNSINAPRTDFLRILNRMMTRKTYHVNEQNELISVITDSNQKLPLTELSSGEKQLLILFGEGLLQQNDEWIYIADEPELSLHVNWQTQLIDDLRSINPHAQMLVATHSPDIVSSYSSRIFDMQKVLG
jgi:predicted ATPase